MWPLVVQDLSLNAAICLTFSINGGLGGCFLQLAGARDKVETRATREEININCFWLGVLLKVRTAS